MYRFMWVHISILKREIAVLCDKNRKLSPYAFRSMKTYTHATQMLNAPLCDALECETGSFHTWRKTTKASSCSWNRGLCTSPAEHRESTEPIYSPQHCCQPTLCCKFTWVLHYCFLWRNISYVCYIYCITRHTAAQLVNCLRGPVNLQWWKKYVIYIKSK